MDKLKFYQVAAVGMLLLNLGLLAFLVLSPAGQRDRAPRPADSLGLDETQHRAFLELAEEHRIIMRQKTDEQREELRQYFDKLTQENAGDWHLSRRYLELEAERVTRTYDHLLDVKGLLRKEQEERYPDFVRQATRRILLDNRPPAPKGKKPRR